MLVEIVEIRVLSYSSPTRGEKVKLEESQINRVEPQLNLHRSWILDLGSWINIVDSCWFTRNKKLETLLNGRLE